MKYLKYISLALALLLCVNINAQKRKSKKAEQKVEQKAEEKVDTVSMSDFSYAYGIAQTNGFFNFLAQRMGVDTTYIADFLQGFEYAEMTPEVLKLKAS